MSRCRRTIRRASDRPASVSSMAPYGTWVTRPRPTSFFTISVTDEAARPSRAASADGVMRLRLPLGVGVDDLDVVLDDAVHGHLPPETFILFFGTPK